jgi:alanyl-tRNA synthetase
VNNDHPQVIEIWNNVFMQFNRLKDGSLQPLPAQHVDTGMGFERLVRVIQRKTSNYDTDVFTGTIAEIEKITGKVYDFSDTKQAIAFRVLADHIRAIAFTIADGQLPSNNGAGYVIRRILRRAVRYYYSYLDYKQPLLFQLMPTLAKQFETVFPELTSQLDFVTKVVKEEEDGFLRTLENGIKLFNGEIQSAVEEFSARVYRTNIHNPPLWERADQVIDFVESNRNLFKITVAENPGLYQEFEKCLIISGKVAFKLQDTYGFPIDLTDLLARELGGSVDYEGYQIEMLQQKNRSRAAAVVDTEDWINLQENVTSKFVGYNSLDAVTSVIKYRKVKAKGKEGYQIVLAETPFYAESGGQVGDKGTLNFDGEHIIVIDTKKENNLTIHFTEVLPEQIDAPVIAKVYTHLRAATSIHHSATHLLHAALRQVLGTHVAQKGSLVNEEQLRFDFSHFSKVTDEEIAAIEAIVNEKIRENVPVVIKEMNKDEAVKLGAMALFGEKYGDIVRVVIIDPAYSIELCGGTHVGYTGQLGFFKIKHETAVAAGVRRIEAVSGSVAEALAREESTTLGSLRSTLKNPKDIIKAVDSLLAENNELRKKIESLEAKQLAVIAKEFVKAAIDVNGISFIGSNVEVSNGDALKKLCIDLRTFLSNFVIVLTANVEGKAFVAVSIDESINASKGLDAQKIIKEIVAPLIKGGGGGQKLLATAGGQDASNLATVIAKVKALLG